EIHRASPRQGADEIRERLRRSLAEERELVLSPAFFVDIGTSIARVVDVAVLPKLGRQDNELTRYRYDVVIRVAGREAAAPSVESEAMAIAMADGVTRLEDLASELDTARGALFVRGMPNARIAFDREALALLFQAGAWPIGELRQAALDHRPGVHPDDVRAL